MASVLKIDSRKLAVLLKARIEYANTKRNKKVPVKSVKVYRSMIDNYFKAMFAEATSGADAVTFPFVGNLQVLQVTSKKNYAWDKKYNGKDYRLVVDTKKNAVIETDARWYDKVMRAVDRGVEFRNEIGNPVERLNQILNILEHGSAAGKARRRKHKITT